ncbi:MULTISPECIES: NPP1 family protein [unclassified Microbulbifer]|uniref:NPP1 family protein n=1 Tax=unclassified Microbulbifer TaxID=2619833 RepID=UPI0027E4874C|nr:MULTISPECIES: NPP1 family protein [unclassified Microbulbifer]
MSFNRTFSALLFGTAVSVSTHASDFAKLDKALPAEVNAESIAPVFDFDTDGCLPGTGISRNGEKNGGLKPTGSITGDCRSGNFLDISNTVHRYVCTESGGATYCGHFYALYFEKDQILDGINSGHRHDWEYAAVWTTNGVVTHGSYSAHGELTTAPASQLPFENGHLKIVYHKDGIGTHAFRFAKDNEYAENPYGAFVTPEIVSWYQFYGDGLDNREMRNRLNGFDYGSANLPMRNSSFLRDINRYRPSGYPEFNEYVQLMNNASDLCLDITDGVVASGTNVHQWHCSGSNWQKWSYDADTGEIRSKHDSDYCLYNGGVFENGANLIIWACNGNDHQRFTLYDNGSIAARAAAKQVVDGYGTYPGDNVGTWSDWGGSNQRWTMVL